MLDVRKMALLRELARLGTIAAVAQAQFCTPSAVSQQLAALEREAGVPLLRRSGRGVVLTAAGADLAERAGGVLALLEEASAALASARAELSGELRIGAFPTAVRTLLPAALVALGAAHPRLELHVTELDPAQVPDALQAGLLDIALVHEYDYVPAEPDPALVTRAAAVRDRVPGLRGRRRSREPAGARPGPGQPGAAVDRRQPGHAVPPDGGPALPGGRVHAADPALRRRLRRGADAGGGRPGRGGGARARPGRLPATAWRWPPLSATRRTLIACRRGATAHPAIAACAAAMPAAAAAYPGLAT